ncbi:MAG: hypothetical protein ACI8S6_000063, partial [Myxococcota bacterium]
QGWSLGTSISVPQLAQFIFGGCRIGEGCATGSVQQVTGALQTVEGAQP